jgi:hypothetical protein
METHLARIVRDNAGHIHNRGEHVTILGAQGLVAGPVG